MCCDCETCFLLSVCCGGGEKSLSTVHPMAEAVESRREVSAKHKRSKSDSEKKDKKDKLDPSIKSFHLKMDIGEENLTDMKRRASPKSEEQSLLKEEIEQLEKCLKDQIVIRRALEKAMGSKSFAVDSTISSSLPKPTKELIREIAMLELEVMYLEQHLLYMYRRAFEQQIPNASMTSARYSKKESTVSQSASFSEAAILDLSPRKNAPEVQSCHFSLPRMSVASSVNEAYSVGSQEKLGLAVHRSHSSLLHRAAFSARVSPSAANLARALGKSYTLPLSYIEHEDSANADLQSLADHLGTNIDDHVSEAPNRISEDMIRSMAAIYCKLKDSLDHQPFSSSPTSSVSTMSSFSPRFVGHFWSPGCKREPALSARLRNPMHMEGIKELSEAYNSMVEVSSMCNANRRPSEIDEMMHKYKLLVHRLETINPRQMNKEEKLAFWINIHNSMLMHAHLEHGIPQNNLKRAALLSKIAYSIGGRNVNPEAIQGSILGCRSHPPGQWLRVLLSPRVKIKDGNEWEGYAIDHPEPKLRFALCSGSHSDPPVRIYISKNLLQQLEDAKAEYILGTVSIRKEHKILLPKIVESFAKDSNLTQAELLDIIKNCLPQTLGLIVHDYQQSRSRKSIEWVPHNFTFRYLLSRELADCKMS